MIMNIVLIAPRFAHYRFIDMEQKIINSWAQYILSLSPISAHGAIWFIILFSKSDVISKIPSIEGDIRAKEFDSYIFITSWFVDLQ